MNASKKSPDTRAVPPAAGSRSVVVGEPLSAAERYRRIAEGAYFRAEARGFAGDRQIDDWLAAERDIDAWTVSFGTPRAPKSSEPAKPSEAPNPRAVHRPSKAR